MAMLVYWSVVAKSDDRVVEANRVAVKSYKFSFLESGESRFQNKKLRRKRRGKLPGNSAGDWIAIRDPWIKVFCDLHRVDF